MTNHLETLVARHPTLADCTDDIQSGFALMRDCFAAGGKLLLCGNGGSAADCEHWAGELLKGFRLPRRLAEGERAGLPDAVAAGLQAALPAIPLTGFVSFQTAFANDEAPDLNFAQLVQALGRPGDVLAALTTSGRSRNVLHALAVAKARGLGTLALTGRGGGPAAETADVAIRVPAEETLEVQELHLPVYHALCAMLEDHFFAPDRD